LVCLFFGLVAVSLGCFLFYESIHLEWPTEPKMAVFFLGFILLFAGIILLTKRFFNWMAIPEWLLQRINIVADNSDIACLSEDWQPKEELNWEGH
jgi:uncharacterized membrane protein HdeD (DUF308 family)